MPEKISDPKPPSGLSRLAFRIPIYLYKAHLGWLLGERFTLLTHKGRKSGLARQTVLEIVRCDRTNRACVVASGWGKKSDWFQNVSADPNIAYQIRNHRTTGIAERLTTQQAGDELVDYARRHPLALQELARFMGYRLDGSEEDIRALGEILPMFLFKPS